MLLTYLTLKKHTFHVSMPTHAGSNGNDKAIFDIFLEPWDLEVVCCPGKNYLALGLQVTIENYLR